MNPAFKKTLSILILGVLIIGTLAVVYFFGFARPETLAEKQGRVAEVIERGEVERCQQFTEFEVVGVNYQTVCEDNIKRNEAFNTLQITSCEALSTPESVKDCKQGVVIKSLEKGQGENYCQTLSGEDLSNFCLNQVAWKNAEQSGNLEQCAPIENPSLRFSCESNAELSAMARGKDVDCSTMNQLGREDCESMKAGNCVAISHQALSNTCLEKTESPQ